MFLREVTQSDQGSSAMLSETLLLSQPLKPVDPQKSFFGAVQRGEFKRALEILEQYPVDPNLPDRQGATALYYVAHGETLDPDIFRAFLEKGADPALRSDPSPQDMNALDHAIQTGFYYYTQFRMTDPSNPNLHSNFLKTVELLASYGVTPKEDLFAKIEKKSMHYNLKIWNYDGFRADIFSALERGNNSFKKLGPPLKRRKITPGGGF